MNSKQKIVYPSPRDLKAILLDNANRTDIKAFLRKKGIFFFIATPEDMTSSVSEIIFGYTTKSMGLLADGYHRGTHALALGLTLIAYILARCLVRKLVYALMHM